MEFELQPTLRGDLLELRPLHPDDYDELFAVASDPLIWEQHPESDRHAPEKFRRYFDGAMQSRGAFAVVDLRTGLLVGSTRFHGHDAEASTIEIGWTFLARSHWGGPHNREMKRLMLSHAFRFVDRVVFLIGPRNIRSQRAVEKIGGARAGSRTIDGSESFLFEITSLSVDRDWLDGARG
ncbi:MAG: GNAT family N-acetyltransferase [Gemmatimonadaceae bacterium]